jgi:hypothetical protein
MDYTFINSAIRFNFVAFDDEKKKYRYISYIIKPDHEEEFKKGRTYI